MKYEVGMKLIDCNSVGFFRVHVSRVDRLRRGCIGKFVRSLFSISQCVETWF